MDHLALSDWMRRLRSARDLTQEALAEQVGCATQTIRAFENGWRRPSRAMAERLASVLEVAAEERAAFLMAARTPVRHSSAETERVDLPADPANYLVRLAAEAPVQLFGPEQQTWLSYLDAELAAIRAALAWALDPAPTQRAERVALALSAASAIERYWHARGLQPEGLDWLEQGLGASEREQLAVAVKIQARALNSAGWLAKLCGRRAHSLTLIHRCLTLYRSLGDKHGTSDALDTLGDLALYNGDATEATWFYAESLELRRELGQPAPIALALSGLGHAEILHGYYERAVAHFAEGLALLHDQADQRSTALLLHGLGLARLRQGMLDEAAPRLGAALKIFDALQNKLDVALCLELIGELLTLRVLLSAEPNPRLLHEAARLWGASERLIETLGEGLSPHDLARRDVLIVAIRRQIGAEQFQAWWAEGRELSLEQAVAAGLAATGV